MINILISGFNPSNLIVGPIEKIWDGSLNTVDYGGKDTVSRQVKNMTNIELTKPSIGFVAHSKGKL